MMQQAIVIVEAEQQRSDDPLAVHFVGGVAEAADHTVRAAEILDLLHAVAVAGLIGQVDALCDDAVATAARSRQPFAWRSHKLVVAGDSRNVGLDLNWAFAKASSAGRLWRSGCAARFLSFGGPQQVEGEIERRRLR